MKANIAALATRDWLHEFALSLCSVLALASIVTPLLILHGVHTGVVESMREQLMKDPAVLVIMPAGSRGAGFEEAFIEEIARRPECDFVIGRTRDVASELQVRAAQGGSLSIALEPTAPGDPLLLRHGCVMPEAAGSDRLEVVLSAPAAGRLKVQTGAYLEASLGRRLASGKLDRLKLRLKVVDVLPPSATGMESGFVAMPLLLAIQDFRDGYQSALLGVSGQTGEIAPGDGRYFESFRVYVHNIDEVEGLEEWFKSRDVLVKTRSRDIANIRSIDRTLTSLVLIITAATGLGFFSFMFSTIHASVRRKWKMLGMLRLIGFSRMNILMFPIVQALLVGGLGVLISYAFYAGVSFLIDSLLEARTGGHSICKIPALDFVFIGLGIEVLVILAALRVALRASRIEPSAVIRES